MDGPLCLGRTYGTYQCDWHQQRWLRQWWLQILKTKQAADLASQLLECLVEIRRQAVRSSWEHNYSRWEGQLPKEKHHLQSQWNHVNSFTVRRIHAVPFWSSITLSNSIYWYQYQYTFIWWHGITTETSATAIYITGLECYKAEYPGSRWFPPGELPR